MDNSTLQSMLLKAYQGEREADAFYTRLLGETDDFEAVDALAEARRDERVHAEMIRGLILNLTGELPEEPSVEIPQYQSFEEAIRLAMVNEREAAEFYGRIISFADNPEVKNTFYYIREDEIVHALKFEALLNELSQDQGGESGIIPPLNFPPEL